MMRNTWGRNDNSVETPELPFRSLVVLGKFIEHLIDARIARHEQRMHRAPPVELSFDASVSAQTRHALDNYYTALSALHRAKDEYRQAIDRTRKEPVGTTST
jgi:hypothetical protein